MMVCVTEIDGCAGAAHGPIPCSLKNWAVTFLKRGRYVYNTFKTI